jgi:DegV family protein with EDD domain
MSKVVLFTDSTSDLPKHYVEENDIRIVPLTVHFGDEEYKDWYDLTPAEFYAKLTTSSHTPTTSQVPPQRFVEEYEKELIKGNSILSIHLSSKVSGTYQAAVTAKNMLESSNIEVVDSKGMSIGFGLIVLEAAKMLKQGLGIKETADRVRAICDKQQYYFSVDTLEYLKRGGRLSPMKAMIGTILNMKPILCVKDGAVEPLDKVRGRKKVFARLIELSKEAGVDFSSQSIAVAHACVPDVAAEFANEVKKELNPKEILIAEIGSVIGTHAGPGAIGIFFKGK